MAQRTTSLQIRRAMQADRDAGMSIQQIAAKYGWGHSTVSDHTIGTPVSVVTPDIARAMQADRDAGLSAREIGRKHGWHQSTVLDHTVGKPPTCVTPCAAAAMQADRDAGMTVADIADKHGWSKMTVCRLTTGPRVRHTRDLARYRRMIAANASPEADRAAIAGRFGLANKNVLAAIISKGRRFLAEAARATP